MSEPTISSTQANRDSSIRTKNKPSNNPQGAEKFRKLNPNWTEKWFELGNHRYSYRSPDVCEKNNSDCTIKSLVKIMNKMSAYPNQKKEFIPSEKHVGDVDIPGPWGVDDVSSTAIYNKKGTQIGIKNQTLENHKLHNGVVERTINESKNKLFIQTKGAGYSTLGGPNVWLPELIWGEVDQLLINEHNKNKAKK
ncbi:MAG: hypothetical protein V3V19_06550 [Cocleimonas sp.]